MERAVVAIPIYKPKISYEEEIALRQMFKVLGGHPINFFTFRNLDTNIYLQIARQYTLKHNLTFNYFHPEYFTGIKGYNRLLLSPSFYRQYTQYQYMLIYQPDSFVFRDDLLEWCDKGYDYIGSPWLKGWSKADANAPFTGVGNGGFSLRKVSSHLKALNSFSYIQKPSEVWKRFNTATFSQKPRRLLGVIRSLTIANNTHHWFNNFQEHEDRFWGIYVNRNHEWFSLPDIQEALQFSFEVQPQRMYELNGRNLPFGCHAWWKQGLDFWRPFLREYGHEI